MIVAPAPATAWPSNSMLDLHSISSPSSFIDSHLTTKAEYAASLKLTSEARLAAETAALVKKVEMMKMLQSYTPTASIASSNCADDCSSNSNCATDISDGGCCGK